ncbi:MAG: hypothetical protein LBI45_03580 [Bacteroidales bacterium]|nr:hypothetical protein [Bacteroidales bacterium]
MQKIKDIHKKGQPENRVGEKIIDPKCATPGNLTEHPVRDASLVDLK